MRKFRCNKYKKVNNINIDMEDLQNTIAYNYISTRNKEHTPKWAG